jgi:hypothetical protein
MVGKNSTALFRYMFWLITGHFNLEGRALVYGLKSVSWVVLMSFSLQYHLIIPFEGSGIFCKTNT